MQSTYLGRRTVIAASAGLLTPGVAAGGDRDRDASQRDRDGGGARNRLVVAGGSPENVVEYQFVVSGRARRSGRAGDAPVDDSAVTVDEEDRIEDGSLASGAVAGGADAYVFTGRISRFNVSLTRRSADEVRLFLNGERVRPSELGDDSTAGTPVEFLDCNTAVVTGDFEGVQLNVSFWAESGLGTSVLFPGPVSGVTTLHPADQFAPDPFAIDSVRLDPDPIETPGAPAQFSAANPFAGPWCEDEENQFPNHLVVAGGSPENVVEYGFAVTGSARKTDSAGDAPVPESAVTVDTEDRIANGRVGGAVAGGADAYRFSGAIAAFRVDGSAAVFLNGERVRPDDLHGSARSGD
ncbi:hypothetical protein [Halomicrococcus sp. SG-WS-1]|uniref:hypothetical protein n=1 Tax=Halomicrococcus sp. SG-WS-1 TaxID=3439057 RepID=UPI003F7B2625